MSNRPRAHLDRSRFLTEIQARPDVDVLVVGGGIAGVATARDLALQGLRVVVVERDDIASGASGALTRIAQGGFRYLERGEIGLVARAVAERNRFVAAAPHQVRPIRLILPSRTLFGGAFTAITRFLRVSGGHSLPGAALLRAAVGLYQFLGRATRILPDGGLLGARALERGHPGIARRYAGGAYEFEGLIASPERVAVELAEEAVATGTGSAILTRTRIVSVGADGVHLVDEIAGETATLRPRAVVAAAGARADVVARLFGVAARMVDGVAGTHLLLRSPALVAALGGDLLYFEDGEADPARRRLCCAYATDGIVVLGATEVPVTDPDTSAPSAEEEAYLLGAVRHLFPEVAVGPQDVIGRLHGVRPLAVAATDDVTGRSRDHAIHVHDGPILGVPLVSIAGGKWTTFRAIAADATDAVLARLGRSRRVSTEALPIGGGRDFPLGAAARTAAARDLARRFELDPDLADRLIATYGSRAARVAARVAEDDGRRAIAGTSLVVGEVRFFRDDELATRADDVLRRRTRLWLTGTAGPQVAAEVAAILAEARADAGRHGTGAADGGLEQVPQQRTSRS